jgi:dinuclear metal center YbgI/SA1388 family protein
MMADISLLAYHLPLDAHPLYGNNQQLANQLDLTVEGGLPGKLGLYGKFKQQTTLGEVADICNHQLHHQPLIIPASHKDSSVMERLAWCTGAAADLIFEAKSIGANAFITGEINERAVHWANELDVVLIAAGHHATERYGVRALADHLSKQFFLEHKSIEIYSPV